jgi:hypothetical protein
MKSPDPNASNAPDKQAKPIGFSRRQLLAGTPLAAPTYEEILLTSWLAANPAQLVADPFGLTLDQVNKFPKDSDGIIAARI